MPAVPARANNSQVAARTMFCVTTTPTALTPVTAARSQNRTLGRVRLMNGGPFVGQALPPDSSRSTGVPPVEAHTGGTPVRRTLCLLELPRRVHARQRVGRPR